MATYAYLVDPENQFMTKSGTINTAGVLRVYDAATDDPVITYKDFMGTENEEAIQLDDNGRAIVIADSDKAYRLEVYDRYGTLLWTTTPLWCQAGGGGANIARTDIVSSDGTVEITKTVVGSTTTFDLSTDVDDGTDLLEWIRCDGFVLHDNGCYVPEYTAGTMDIGDDGVNLYANRYYHITGHIKAVKGNVVNQPFYDDVVVHFIGHNGEDEDVEFQTYKLDVDYSMAMPQIFEVSTDILAPSDIELLIKIDNAEISGATFSLEDLAIHRVFSGAPALPGGAASKPWVYEEFQEKLIPGTGITIDENNVISATAAQQRNADWLANSGVEEILNKPDLSVYATKEEVTEDLADKQDVLIEGDNITIIDNVISAKEQVNSDWNANSGVEQILNKPDLTQYATKTEVAEDLAGKQDVLTPGSNITIENNVISATAEPQVNADWLSNSGVSEILNKPDLSVYAEKSELADYQPLLTPGTGITIDENNVISAEGGTFTQVNSDWDSTSGVSEILNKPDLSVYAEKSELAPVATSGSYNDLTDKPTIVGQVNSDWDATSGVEQILNKPDLSIYADKSELSTIATTGDYDDLLNKPTITQPVNADWNSNSGLSQILNKPDLSQYATQSELSDYQPLLTAGDNISIQNNVISATAAPQVNADWLSDSGVSEILNKPDLSVYAEKSELSTVATTGDYDDLLNKPTITEPVNADWNSNSGLSKILNKPNLSQYATTSDLAGKQDTLTAGNNISIVNNVISATTDQQIVIISSAVSASDAATAIATALSNNMAVLYRYNDGHGTQVDMPLVYYPSSNATEYTFAGWVSENRMFKRSLVYETDAWSWGTLVKRTISTEPQVNSDWTATSGVAEILNKPEVKPLVAGSGITITEGANAVTIESTGGGSYTQVNSDWTATSGVAKILNKPNLSIYAKSSSLATVATTGAYSDLSGKPNLATVATTGDYDDLTDKPDLSIYAQSSNLATVATSGDYDDLLDKPDLSVYAQSSSLATVATSGSYEDLTDKPTINNVPAVTSSDDDKVLKASYSGGVGSYSWETAPSGQVNSDWEATSGVAEILNKPDLVDIVAGPGIVVDNPNGNTLRVSTDSAYEVELYSGTKANAGCASFTLSEYASNFDRLRFYGIGYGNTKVMYECPAPDTSTEAISVCYTYYCRDTDNNPWQMRMGVYTSTNGLDFSIRQSKFLYGSDSALAFGGGNTTQNPPIYRIVGVKRIAGGN